VGPVGGALKESEDDGRSLVLAEQAVKHFTDMENLDISPSPRGNVDMFVMVHAKVRL